MVASTVKITIAIFKGDPVDLRQFRHTSIYFEFADSSTEPVTMHIVGPPQQYEFQILENHHPLEDPNLAKAVSVGQLSRSVSRPELESIFRRVPPNNSSIEFNCQNWVGDALERLRDLGLLSAEEVDKGLDGMVDAIWEAQDE